MGKCCDYVFLGYPSHGVHKCVYNFIYLVKNIDINMVKEVHVS